MKNKLGVIMLMLMFSVLLTGCTNVPNNKAPKPEDKQVNTQANDSVNPSGLYSINELMSMNKPMKCTWKENVNGKNEVTNVIYINNKKFYQDVTMENIGHSFTISDGDNLYMWNNFNKIASKMKFSDIKISPQPGQQNAQTNTGQSDKKDYLCGKWTADNTFFVPPTDRTFNDVTEGMNSVLQGKNTVDLEKSKKQLCDMCQNAPDEKTKNECRVNAKCD